MTTTTTELEHHAAAAWDAAPIWRAAGAWSKSRWLRAIADALDASADELITIAHRETHLGTDRLTGEVARTTGQLRLFAEVVGEGSYLELTVDDADPSAHPPRPELRRILVGVGPVGVFSASNFPFAFSVCGGDTASALAAGNPVIVKAHSGHPELSRRTAWIANSALQEAGAPAGSLSLIEGREAGNRLVQHRAIKAVGFTGSLSAGRALFDMASSRSEPIPFYGELGSINPVVITPAALAERRDELAVGLVNSFTMGFGQFCTKPGVVFIPKGRLFEQAVSVAVERTAGGPLLTDRITAAFPEGVETLISHPAVEVVARGSDTREGPRPVVLATDTAAVLQQADALLDEVFGPLTLLVRYSDDDDLHRALHALPASLTATLHAEPTDRVTPTLEILQEKAGRVVFGGWPTGVAVTWSQQHGGPWPATTSLHTSVGASAIRRFLRPLTYQDAPSHLLPAPLRDEALRDLPHRRNGKLLLPVES